MTGGRRRGEELEHALLTTAWAELLEVGYQKLTMENVATRAGTSKPVIYRRWPTKAKLVLAALAHNTPLQESDIDTGSLRGDLLELVSRGIERFRRVPGDTLPGLITETFSEPDVFEDLRRNLAQDETLELIRPFLTRAVERGELRTDRCSDRVLRVPSDLLRSETLLHGTMVDDAAIIAIVDDIALPCSDSTVEPRRPGARLQARPRRQPRTRRPPIFDNLVMERDRIFDTCEGRN